MSAHRLTRHPARVRETATGATVRTAIDMPVAGTAGYAEVVDGFIEATHAIPFATLHGYWLDLIPDLACRVLDVGAGIGRDAHALAAMGHRVTAVEPLPTFRAAAKRLHDDPRVTWTDGALPALADLDPRTGPFDVVLASAVWHHLDEAEREAAMARLSSLLRPEGLFALTLRHGPAGAGTHAFTTSRQHTIELADMFGFDILRYHAGQPSLLPGKADVTWTQLASARRAPGESDVRVRPCIEFGSMVREATGSVNGHRSR